MDMLAGVTTPRLAILILIIMILPGGNRGRLQPTGIPNCPVSMISISLIDAAARRAEVVFNLLVYRQECTYTVDGAEPIGDLTDQVIAKLALELRQHVGPPPLGACVDWTMARNPLINPPLNWIDRPAARDATRFTAELAEIDAIGERPVVILI